jgi:hypothetical protein
MKTTFRVTCDDGSSPGCRHRRRGSVLTLRTGRRPGPARWNVLVSMVRRMQVGGGRSTPRPWKWIFTALLAQECLEGDPRRHWRETGRQGEPGRPTQPSVGRLIDRPGTALDEPSLTGGTDTGTHAGPWGTWPPARTRTCRIKARTGRPRSSGSTRLQRSFELQGKPARPADWRRADFGSPS